MSETTTRISSTAPETPTAMTTGRGVRWARIALRSLQILLALFYGVASALPKLIAHPSAVESFDHIGWGTGAMYTIGALELAGAVGLLIPVLQSVAATALGMLMVGAFIVQLTVFDGQNAATPLILIVPLTVIAWARRGHNRELRRLLRRG
ncbi:DoxX family protein [Streptomyces sp. LP11]|uniref:DoxX family protein n=1 Tax=Streptomyces pyxinicus TaxID=2970331 RepID=A0ABT2B490_9ACTN|nr:DoxX family protein [Streptomyces sp. LP11]MCS0603334.1 DoxX family protein [Streptomyces sp. LP11]